ncbi:hypothetical protein Tco_1121724 [Tanacetum coccineum]|uniref:Uncharacterized protein n=1 Tax=Tanacetum coccineum TaxID=301880 RepID=A0ABQ5J293_9ASTR
MARDILDLVEEQVITSASSYSFTIFSIFGKILETCALTSVLTASFILFVSLWSNANKEPKLGRFCREELGTVVGVGTGVCCICVLRGVGGRGRVVANTRGGSAIAVTGTSTSEVASVLRVNIKSKPVSGLGLRMLETKLDDTEELYC